MEWRDNEGVPRLVFGEELSIGEGLGKARVARAIIFRWNQGVELIFPRTNNDEIFNRGDTFGIKIVETNCFIRFGFFFFLRSLQIIKNTNFEIEN